MTVYNAVSTFKWVGETWRDAENKRWEERNEALRAEIKRKRKHLDDLMEKDNGEPESPVPPD